MIRETHRESLVRIVWTLLFACFCFATPAQSLVAHGDTWHYRKGTSANPSGWKTAADANLDAS